MPATEDKRCPRCFIGIDDDGDGNCKVCANLGDWQALQIRERITAMVTNTAKIVRNAAFDEIVTVTARTNAQITLAAIERYRQRYPNHGDLRKEQDRILNAVVPHLNCLPCLCNSDGYPVIRNNGCPFHNAKEQKVCSNEITVKASFEGPALAAIERDRKGC